MRVCGAFHIYCFLGYSWVLDSGWAFLVGLLHMWFCVLIHIRRHIRSDYILLVNLNLIICLRYYCQSLYCWNRSILFYLVSKLCNVLWNCVNIVYEHPLSICWLFKIHLKLQRGYLINQNFCIYFMTFFYKKSFLLFSLFILNITGDSYFS